MRAGRHSLLLACVLLACVLLMPAAALGQAADDGPLPGGIADTDQGDKDQGDKDSSKDYPLEPFQLKDPEGVSVIKPISWLQAIPHVLAQIVWQLAIEVLWIAVMIFNWAFEIDLVNGSGGALGPIGQTVDGLYGALGDGFLVAAVLVAGLWALFRGVTQRRYAQTIGGLGLSFLCVAGAMWAITDPEASVGQVASWSQDASAELLSLTQEAAPAVASDGPGAPLSGSSSEGTKKAADTLFNTGAAEPAEAMNEKELVEVKSGLRRLGLAALATIGTLGIALLVGLFSLAIVLLQAIALLIFAFAPVALIAAVVPGRGHDVFFTWARRLGGALLSKALLSLLLGVVLAVSAAVLAAGKAGGGAGGAGSAGGAGDAAWFTGFFLYASFFWFVLIFYNRIFGGLPLRAAAAPVSGAWGVAKARYREHRQDMRTDARDRHQEALHERHTREQRHERGLEKMRQGRDHLERELTPAQVRDERALAKQRALRQEQAQLEGKASPTPKERKRLEEVRAAVVSDDAYAGLKERLASSNGGAGVAPATAGFPFVGAARSAPSGIGHHGHAQHPGRLSGDPVVDSPMGRALAENQARADTIQLPTGVRSVEPPRPRERPRIEFVEDARARVHSSSTGRPPPAARTPWIPPGRDGGGNNGGDA